jgi:hypothetical protein
MTEDDDSRRLELVQTAQQLWIAALTDLGGRNTLLYYKDRRAGTLDLAQADKEALDRFIERGFIKLTRLFKDADVRADAIRRVQAIHRKARELFEERGIRAGYLATGMARWDELFLEPAAPVLLRGLTITPTRARYDDSLGVRELVVCGVVTNLCVETTVRSAFMRDFPVTLLADCCAAKTRRLHELSIEVLISYELAEIARISDGYDVGVARTPVSA